MPTGIEYLDETWNPVLGCQHRSTGCSFCWAEAVSSAHASHPNPKIANAYEGLTKDGKWTGKVRLLNERIMQPTHWRNPRIVGVNFMADIFRPAVPFQFIDRMFKTMGSPPCERHTFLTLTKFTDRMVEYFNRDLPFKWPLPNVWVGVSVENLDHYDRIFDLQKIDAALRWISFEPLLGPIDILPLEGIKLCVVGGESGSDARAMHPDWARFIRDKCKDADVSFFFKQWGKWAPAGQKEHIGKLIGGQKCETVAPKFTVIGRYAGWPRMMAPVGKKTAGYLLDGVEHREWPA